MSEYVATVNMSLDQYNEMVANIDKLTNIVAAFRKEEEERERLSAELRSKLELRTERIMEQLGERQTIYVPLDVTMKLLGFDLSSSSAPKEITEIRLVSDLYRKAGRVVEEYQKV